MPYRDFASLLPAEAYYTGPRGRVDAAKIEATKRATYLSSMDQFYAQLEEMERQFDITAGMKERELEFETGERFEWEKEIGRGELDLRREALEFETGPRFEWEKEYGTEELELRGEEIEMKREVGLAGPRATRRAAQWQYDLGVKELEWEKEEAEMTEGFLKDYFEKFPGEIRY